MSDLLVRNIDDDVLLRLSEMAKKKGVSRNTFIREQLELLAEYPDLMERDSKYEEVFNRVIPIQEKTLQMLASNINLMNETRQTMRKNQKMLEVFTNPHFAEDVYNDINKLAAEKNINFSAAAKLAVDFYLKYGGK